MIYRHYRRYGESNGKEMGHEMETGKSWGSRFPIIRAPVLRFTIVGVVVYMWMKSGFPKLGGPSFTSRSSV